MLLFFFGQKILGSTIAYMQARMYEWKLWASAISVAGEACG